MLNLSSELKDKLIDVISDGLITRLNLKATVYKTHLDYMRQHIWIKDMESRLVRFIPKPLQIHHYNEKLRYKEEGKGSKFLLLKYRRGGFTTLEQAQSYVDICRKTNIDCTTLAQDKEATKNIFKMVHLMHTHNNIAPQIGYDSKTEISYPELNNYFYIGTSRSRSYSRGGNIHRIHGSEVAHWELNTIGIENLVSGMLETARYGEIVLETTANGAHGWFYHTFKEAMEGKNSWVPLFYPWYMDDMNSIEANAEQIEEILDTLNDEEIAITDEYKLNVNQLLWRRVTMRSNKLFKQEYPANWNEAFLVRGTTFFNKDTLEQLTYQCHPPIKDSDNLTIWAPPLEGREYVAGADCSEGVDRGDDSMCGILDKITGEQVARLMGKWRPEVFARKAIELCRKYNNAVFACEVNNHGHSVLNTVINTLKYRYIYYRMDSIKKSSSGLKIKEKKPGWHTNASTRPILLDDLNEALEDGYMQVNDRQFIEQCKTFVDRGGKYEASEGEKDDLVIGWGIAWQARKAPKKGTVLV